MHENLAPAAVDALQPGGRARDLGGRARAQPGIELFEGGGELAIHAHRLAADRAGELQVVIADHEQPAPFVDQPEHQAQRAGAVRTVVGEIAQLHHEQVGFGGGGETAGVAVHVAHHAHAPARRQAAGGVDIGDAHAARTGSARNAARARGYG